MPAARLLRAGPGSSTCSGLPVPKKSKAARTRPRKDHDLRVLAFSLSCDTPYTPQDVYLFLTAKDPTTTARRTPTGFQRSATPDA